nr:hypothetical protein [Streptomyces sp. NRRL S-241]
MSLKKKLVLSVVTGSLVAGGVVATVATSNAAAPDVVCKGSTVTLSGEAGPPAATSGTFPVGTKLKVTNLDNGQATTVTVNGPSGSCVLLNNAAFDCPGSTVTLSGEAGAPAASSGTFPVGTKLKVTNLDNGQATTVTVNGPSGSCVLLNNAAFDTAGHGPGPALPAVACAAATAGRSAPPAQAVQQPAGLGALARVGGGPPRRCDGPLSLRTARELLDTGQQR